MDDANVYGEALAQIAGDPETKRKALAVSELISAAKNSGSANYRGPEHLK